MKSVIKAGLDVLFVVSFPDIEGAATRLLWLESFNGSLNAFKSALVVDFVLIYPERVLELPNEGVKILPGLL